MHVTSGGNLSTPDRASSSGRRGTAAAAVGTSPASAAHKRKPSDGSKTKVRRYSTFQRTNGDLGGHHRTASERELSGDRRGSPRRRRDDGPFLASGMSSPGFPGAGLGRENVDPVPAAAPSVARRNLDFTDADLAAVALQFPEEAARGRGSAGGSTTIPSGAAPSMLFSDPGTGRSGIRSSMAPSPPRPSKGPAAIRSILGEMPSPSPKSLYNSPPRSNSSRSNSVCSSPRGENPNATGTGRCLPSTPRSLAFKFGAATSSHHSDTAGMDIDDDAPQASLSAAAMAAGQAAQMAITATTITSSTGLTMRRKASVGDVIGPFQETEVGAGATDTTTGGMNMIDLPPDLHEARRTPLGGVAGPFSGSLNFGDELMAEADDNEPVTSTKNDANDAIVPRGSGTIVRRRRSSSNSGFGTPSGSPVATRRRSGGGGSLFASPSSRQHTPRLDFHSAQTPMRYTFGFNKNPFAPLTPDIQMMINGHGEAPLTSTDGSPLGPSRPIYPKSDGAFDFNGGGRIKAGSNLLFSVGGSRPGGGSSNSNPGRKGGRRVNRPCRRASPPNFAISIPDLACASPARRSGAKDAPDTRRSPSGKDRYRKREGGQIVDMPLDQEISPDTVGAFPHQQLRRSPGIDYYVTLKDSSSGGTNMADAAADTSFGSSGSTGSRAPPLPPTKTRPAISRLPPCSRSPSPSRGIPGSALSSSPMVQTGDIDEPSSRRSNCSVRSNGLNNSTSSVASFNYNRYDNDFQEIDMIGRGSFGEVCRAIHRLEGILYAIKKIEVRNECDLTLKMKEIYALAALSDSSCGGAFHIVRYHHSWVEGSGCDEPKRLFIQMELCDHTLVQEIEQGRLAQDNGDRLFKLLREMCLALNVIHTNNLVHLDVKPDNIFIKDDKFKLGDFGLANSIDAGDTDEGDNRYMAREMLAFHSVDRARCDIFSLGATMYRICLGRELPGSGDEWNDIRNDKLDQLEGTHPELKRYIAEMMHSDPSKRPAAKELLTREFLLSDQEKQLLAQRRQVQELEEQLRKAQLQVPKSGLVRSSSIL